MTEETKPKTHAEIQRNYHQRMREAGFVRISAWIPEARRAEFWNSYDKLKAKWNKEGLFDGV